MALGASLLLIYVIGCWLAGKAMVMLIALLRDIDIARQQREEAFQRQQSILIAEWLRETAQDKTGR